MPITIGGKTYDVTQKLLGIKNLGSSTKAVLSGQSKPATLGASSSKLYSPAPSQSKNLAGPVYKPSSTSTSSGTSNKSSGGSSSGQQEQRITDTESERRKQADTDYDAMLAQIDSEYKNINSSLNTQEGALTAQQPITEGQITSQAEESLAGLGGQQSEALAGLGAQATSAQQGTTGVLNQARQTYNELLSGASKFGGSAQEAYGELLGRSTAQTMGEAQTNLQTALTQIAGERARTTQYYNDKINAVKTNRDNAIQQARLDYQTNLNKIRDAKYKAADWKANQALSALSDFQSQVADITDAANTAKNALDRWNASQAKTLQDQYTQANIQLKPTGNLASKFAGPQQSPVQGQGAVTTDEGGSPWVFVNGKWEPLKKETYGGSTESASSSIFD